MSAIPLWQIMNYPVQLLLRRWLDISDKIFPNPQYTYRFVFAPETIGALAYLDKNIRHLKNNVVCGFNLSCVGDERGFSHIASRTGKTLADLALISALIGKQIVKTYSYLERGSDERQYGAPLVDLPFCGFSRSKYGEYPEYHTDADNFDLVTADGLQGSFEVMANIIRAFEFGLNPKTESSASRSSENAACIQR